MKPEPRHQPSVHHGSIILINWLHVYKIDKNAKLWTQASNRYAQLLCAILSIYYRTRLCTHVPLHWRHNGCDGVSNHQPHDSLLNLLLRRRSKKTSKLRVTGLCAGNSPETGEFPAQMVSNAENVSSWWRHHDRYERHDHYRTMIFILGIIETNTYY